MYCLGGVGVVVFGDGGGGWVLGGDYVECVEVDVVVGGDVGICCSGFDLGVVVLYFFV